MRGCRSCHPYKIVFRLFSFSSLFGHSEEREREKKTNIPKKQIRKWEIRYSPPPFEVDGGWPRRLTRSIAFPPRWPRSGHRCLGHRRRLRRCRHPVRPLDSSPGGWGWSALRPQSNRTGDASLGSATVSVTFHYIIGFEMVWFCFWRVGDHLIGLNYGDGCHCVSAIAVFFLADD